MSGFVLPARVPVLLGGGRSLEPGSALSRQSAAVARALVRQGHPVHVGCAAGADAFVVHALLGFPAMLRVFAVGLPSGAGFWGGSAIKGVLKAQSAGASVRWSAGGPLSVGLTQRLFLRSVACLRGCSLSVFFAPGPGSCSVARASLKARIPVIAFCAFPPELPVPAVACRFQGLPAWLFQPA
jgi:hypothetical protein